MASTTYNFVGDLNCLFRHVTYRAAFETFIATLAAMVAVYFVQGFGPFLFVVDHWIGLVTAALLMSVVQVRTFSVSQVDRDPLINFN